MLKNNHIKNQTHKTQTFPITLIYTKKNNYIKKEYLQTRKYLYNPFHSNNFLKVTIFIKSIHTNSKHPYDKPPYTKNNYIYSYIKKHTYKSQKIWHYFFAHPFSKY